MTAGSSLHLLFGHDCKAITQVQVDVQRMMPQLLAAQSAPSPTVQVHPDSSSELFRLLKLTSNCCRFCLDGCSILSRCQVS
jgi:hypothetical protein